jgi:phosphopantothenoylcysteine decarboxylase/phosphopantothenate--cysteine ligase
MTAMDMSGRTVVLGVTGGIGAYKACEIARSLMRAGATVKVVMTESATKFVTPVTFRALTRQPVGTSMWDEPDAKIHHISLAEEADVLVIAPCTANVIAKLAQGRADDLLTTTALATEAPVVIAPAMNVHMWRKEITQANVAALRARGYVFVEPETGELACGEVGEGRLANVDSVVDAASVELTRACDLAHVRLLVTAGGTREPIDPVRYIGNRSSGRTGFAIAEEAARRGAEVTLVTGPSTLPDPFGVTTVRVETALQMREAAEAAYDHADALIASAAVADFRPAQPAADKIKKADALDRIVLERTADILAELSEWKGTRVLVGFAAESGDPVGSARAKLVAKNLDIVVANDIAAPGFGFDSTRNRVTLVTADGEEALPEMDKRELARILLDRVAALMKGR